jgi:hypothetical protein
LAVGKACGAEDDSMVRTALKTVFLVLLAVFSLSSISEAAPKKAVRHRTRHTRRVATAATTSNKTTTHATKKAATTKRRVAGRTATTTERVAGKTATLDKRVVKRKTTTKPH